MIFIVSLVVSVLVGWARRGRLAPFADLRIRLYGIMVLAFAVRLGLTYAGGRDWAWVASWAPWIFLASYLLLLLAEGANLRTPGFPLIALGTLANFVVIVLNGMRMPVSRASMLQTGQAELIPVLQGHADYMHHLMSSATQLPWLGDGLYIPLPVLNFRVSSFSPGDVLVALGIFWLVQHVMTRPSHAPWSVERAG